MVDKELIAKRLKGLREAAKLSQAKLSKELDVKQPLIARYETAINTPAYGVLIQYADYFDVPYLRVCRNDKSKKRKPPPWPVTVF